VVVAVSAAHLTETSFRKIFPQSLFAASTSFLDLTAGFIVAFISVYVLAKPWILIFYPPLLTIRGNINGVLSGRLSTGLHLGLISPSLKGNTKYFYSLVASVFFTSFICSVVIGFFSYGLSLLLTPGSDLTLSLSLDLSILSMMICTLISVFFLSPTIAITAYRKGADPDIVLYPVLSTMNDILMSGIYVFLVFTLIFWSWAFTIMSLLLVPSFTVLAAYLFVKYRGEDEFKETLTESLPVAIVLTFVSNAAGGFLSEMKASISSHPQLLAVYPSLICNIGEEGSMISSSVSTRLSLGYIEPSMRSFKEKESKTVVSGVVSAGLIAVTGFTLAATLTYTRFPLTILESVLTVVATKLLLLPFIVTLSFWIAVVTFKRGLNPDNITIPVITSISDMTTTVVLFLVSRLILG